MSEPPAVQPSTVRLDVIESADIRGQKTRIRPLLADELSLVYRWSRDPDVAPFWGGHLRYGTFEEYAAHWEPHYLDGSQPARGRCFIVEAGGKPVGMINYNRVDLENRSTEIDVLIGEQGYRGAGYGTDALRAFFRWLFDDVGLHRVWLSTYDYNARARRAYEKVGMTREGVMRDADYIDGRWVDGVIYGILEDEFRRLDLRSP